MPRNKKLEFTIDEPWELVVAAYDEKMYHIPTPDQPEIISMRFSNFHWDEETNITTLSRDSEATIPCPAFVLRYLTTETTLCARFDETVDRNNRRLITLMHNTNLQDMAALSETTIFMAHPDDPNKTLLTVDCNMTIHSTSWIIPKLEGIVIKFYSDALRKARKKDGKRIDDFRELLRAEGRDELSLLSRSEVEAREMAEELKHKGIDPNAVPEDDEGEDDDSDDEFFDAESDEDEDEPADDGGSEEQLDVVEGAGFIAGIDVDEFVVPGEVGIDALPDDETADSGHLRDGELSYEGDSDPDAPMQAKRRGTVRQRLKKAAGKAGAATFWVTATAARKTVKGVRVAVVTSGHAAGHAAGIAKKKAARVVVRKKGSRRRRGDSIRRMNVYKTSTSAPYTWQQFEGTTNYEMALHARKMQLESDWMAEKRRDGSPSVGSPQRPPSQIVEDPPDVGELAAVQPDELEDWLNEGTADDGAPADPLSSVADPPADARRSSAHQDHKREGGSDAESEEDASSRPFVLAPEEVVEIAEVSPKATEAVDARPEVCSNGDTDSVEGSATESVTDATSGASIDDIAQPDVSGGRRSASTHDGDAGDTSIDAGSVDRGSIPSISLGDDTCTDILFDEPGVSESTDVHEESTLEFTSEILQKEYDLILSELARLTRSKMLIDRRPNDDFAAVGDASSAPDFGMLFAMESLEALSSSDPVVVAQARFDVLQKHVTALKQLYVGSSENELGEVRDVLKALAKDIGKDVNLDCTLSPSQPKTRGQRRRAAKAPRSPAVSKRSSTPKEPPLGDTEGSSGAEGIPIPCGRGGSQSSLRQSASSLPLAQAGTDNCSQGSPPVETAAPAKSKGYLSRVKQLKTMGAKAVSGAAAKVTAKKPSTQQTDHDSTSSL